MINTDVLIVGAGPTGLTLAASLVKRGIATTVVDRQAAGSNTSRAAVVNARTLEVLEDLDVARRLVKEGIQAPDFHHPGRSAHADPDRLQHAADRIPVLVDGSAIDDREVALDRLVELGGSVVRPKTLTSVEQDAHGVTATFDDGDTVRARYVVGADGIHSKVREQAGIGFEVGHTKSRSYWPMSGSPATHQSTRSILFWATAGLTVVAPLPGDIYRIVAPVRRRTGKPFRAFVQEILDSRGPGTGRMIVTDVIWGSRFRIHHRVADTYRGGSAAARRRRGARAQPGRRAGNESGHPGCRRTERSAGRRPRRWPGLVARRVQRGPPPDRT